MMFKVLIVSLMAVGISVADSADQPIVLPSGILMNEANLRRSLDAACPTNVTDEMKEDIRKNMARKGQCIDDRHIWGKLKGNTDEVVKVFCSDTFGLKKCLKGFLEEVKPCIGDAGFLLFAEVLDQVHDYFCDDNGERLAWFITEGGFKCVMLMQLRWDVQPIIEKFIQDNDINSVEELIRKDFQKQCSLYNDIIDMVVVGSGAFDACASPVPATMVKDVIKTSLKTLAGSCDADSEEVPIEFDSAE